MPLIPHPRRRRRAAERGMTVVEHLSELRTRLVVSLVAVALGAVVGWVIYRPVFELLTDPFVKACRDLPAAIQPPQGCEHALIAVSVTEPFLVRFKVSTFTGLGLALPIVLYELWRFITPGLTRRERRLAIPFVLSSLLLFALGATFAFLVLPRALTFLLGFSGDTIVPLLTVDRYLGFILFLILAFGLTFEFPLVLLFLALARVITTTQLRRWRRYAYLGVTIAAAVITPSQDPYTMLAMAVPMALFYEAAILVARLFKR
jgi:sec-independent protein translocase protein TatC